MALIKCTECGHDVSEKAQTCPNCGCPIREVQKTNRVSYNAKSSRKSWQYIIMGVLAIALLGVGCYFIKSKTLFNNKSALGVSDKLAKAVDGHYAIILYNDNTGEFYHPNGGRVCSIKLTDGRSEPLKMKLSSSLYLLGKSTDRLILTYNRLFSDFSDYLKYTSSYNPDKSLGVPVEKHESDEGVTYIVALNGNQIEQKNVSKLDFKLKEGCDFFIISYNDEYGVLLGADGKRICGTEKGSTTVGDARIKLSKAVSMFGESIKELYVKGDRMYISSSDLIDDKYAKTGEPSKSKANVLTNEDNNVTIYSLYKGQNPMKDETAGYESGKDTDASPSAKHTDWDITSVEELERKIVGTTWTCRPAGKTWYRLVFSTNTMTLFYSEPQFGKWSGGSEQDVWRYNVTRTYTSDTGEKCYSIQFKREGNELSYGALFFLKGGNVEFSWLRGRQGGKAECKDFNWEE